MYCCKCGTELPDNAVFCSHCGSQTHALKSTTTNQFSKRKSIILILSLSLCIILTLAAAVMVVPKHIVQPNVEIASSPSADTLNYVTSPAHGYAYPITTDTLDGFHYSIMSDNTVRIDKYAGSDSIVFIPESISGSPVTQIGSSAFAGNSSITDVVLPESITRIGNRAFHSCTSITNIQIPTSVTDIGDYAFTSTPWLNNKSDEFVIIGKNILLKYNGMDSEVFIPVGVEEIYCDSFSDNQTMEAIVIPSTVTKIGAYAFADSSSLITVSLPESIEFIGALAFSNTPWFDNLSDEFVIVGADILLDYNGTSSSVVIPQDVKSISSAFFCNQYIESIQIPNGVTNIGPHAFFSCTNLKTISLPNSVSTIAEFAFANCFSLETIQLPSTLKCLEDGVFLNCNNVRLNVKEGSYAHGWAMENNVEFGLMN